jgi:uracil-DNA glycosylase
VVPSEHYALSEVVHCKSKGQAGVKEAFEKCSGLYLERVLGVAAASVIVVMGDYAEAAIKKLAPGCRTGDSVELGHAHRTLVFTPHAAYTGWQPKTFAAAGVDIEPISEKLRAAVFPPGE